MNRQIMSMDKLAEMGFDSEKQLIEYLKIMRSLQKQKILVGIAS